MIEQKIKLTDDISLIPMSDVNPSIMKFLSSPKKMDNPSPSGGIHIADSKFPTSVLKQKIQLHTTTDQPIFYDANADKTLEELCSFLTLHGKSSPMKFHDWIELEDWVPRHHQMLSPINGNGTELDFRQLIPLTQQEWNDLAPTYQQFLALEPEDRLHIQAALNRLKHSKVRWNIVDRAIDLGIALESILLKPNEDKGLKPKFSNRAGWLISRSPDDEYIQHFFHTLYECRSNAVHDGNLQDKYEISGYGEITAVDLIEKGTEFALAVTVKIIEHGSIPQWRTLDVKRVV